MGNYRPGPDFASRSNERAAYMEKIEAMRSKQRGARWCKNHLKSYWGEGFARCVQGNRDNEPCEQGE